MIGKKRGSNVGEDRNGGGKKQERERRRESGKEKEMAGDRAISDVPIPPT